MLMLVLGRSLLVLFVEEDRAGVVSADRLLVRGSGQNRGGQEGVYHQPGRRRGF
jgi:hypothetical protein